MTKPDYDYYGLLADTWDMWRGDPTNQGDRCFFLDIVRQYGQPVLDAGCGTGRIILDQAVLCARCKTLIRSHLPRDVTVEQPRYCKTRTRESHS